MASDRPRAVRVERALDVAALVIDAFADSGYDDADQPALSFGPDKAIAETAMLVYAVHFSPFSGTLREKVVALRDRVASAARSERLLTQVAMRPALAEGLLVPHVVMTALGNPDPDVDALLAACVAAPGGRGRELPPFGVLEKLWIREVAGRPRADDEWPRVLAASVLSTTVDVLGGLREDLYAFTHSVMYATDFGRRGRALPRGPAAILADARSMLAVCLDAGDYDLTGEILLTWPYLGQPRCPAAEFAQQVLEAAEDRAGLLPGGTTSRERLGSLVGVERRRYALATAYHTAYVMGLACAAPSPASERGTTPANPWAAAEGEDLDTMLADAAGLESFRRDVAIASAVRNGNYRSLARLLDREADPSERTPLEVQAAHLVHRLAAVIDRQAAPTTDRVNSPEHHGGAGQA